MSENVKSSQKKCFEYLQFFSIEIDQSTDTTDTAQLAVFVHGINKDFNVVEDFVQLILSNGITVGADILEVLLHCLKGQLTRKSSNAIFWWNLIKYVSMNILVKFFCTAS